MEIKAKPQLNPLTTGGQLKVLEVTAEAGAVMPPHYCTSDAVITVLQGRAQLDLGDRKEELDTGSSFLIPVGRVHILSVRENFRSTVTLSRDAKIKFAE